ncbi:RICIN domain-containing protein [Streptomyces aurantiacus]|nr:RICIN domain-containing protein [Streptomyces aurantiacus]
MSLGEEADYPQAEGRHPAPGEPMDLRKQEPAGETPEPAPLPVIVSPDGSVSIDGIPVPVVGGEAVDVAILDTLHGYARSRNSPVRAAISDPSADYVAIVQVEPDGSSRLVEQRQEGSAGDASASGDTGFAEPERLAEPGTFAEAEGFTGNAGSAEPTGFPEYFDPVEPVEPVQPLEPLEPVEPTEPAEATESPEPPEFAGTAGSAGLVGAVEAVGPAEYPEFPGGIDDAALPDDDAAGMPESAGPGMPRTPRIPRMPQIPAPSLDRGRGPGSVRKRLLRQSDDEYQPPGFLKRPLGIGVAGVVAAAVVIVPLIVLGSSGNGDDQSGASDSSKAKDKAPSTTLDPSPTDSPPDVLPEQPPSASTSVVPKPKEPEKPTAEPTEPKAPTLPETGGDSDIPIGEVLIKNKKYGFCLDLPSTGKGAFDTPVQDGACRPSSSDNQEWALDLAAKGGGTRGADLYLIQNIKSGLCLDLGGYGPAGFAAPVGLFDCNSSNEEDNQLWWLDERPNGTHWIRNQRSGDMCLDVNRSDKKAAHAGTTVVGCSDLDDHEWSFRKS